jgi:GMP synthase-like glutamine amidotransferase
MQRVLVFQHMPVEHPGVFRQFFAEDGVQWDVVELDAGETIPPLTGFDALWVMGGPMDVWDEDTLPWLKAEKAAIREAVIERRMPYLGLCLGHQLLADALGGRVAMMSTPEVGIYDIALTPEGQSDPLFAGLAPIGRCLQWHGSAVVGLPSGATVLAGSDQCPIQAFKVGSNAYGLQYHVEITEQTVSEWSAVPAYAQAMDRVLGAGAIADLEARTRSELPGFNRDARLIYQNFRTIVASG